MTIYLDHAATSPLRKEALDAMLPILTESWGNPSSPHAVGRKARAALDGARESLARHLNADPRELVLTSCGTEAINLAVKGAAWAGKSIGNRIVISAVEHHAVLNSAAYLEKFGFEIVTLPVDRYGRVDADQLTAALNEKTILVSIQLANNEVGTLQPIADLVRRARAQRSALIHVDAVQAAGSQDIDVKSLDVDLLSLAAHKFEGPRGAGLLWLRRGTAILPQMHGGTQERYRRAGTEDVAAAVGMAAAFELACAERAETGARLRRQRDHLRDALKALPDVEVTGHPRSRLPGLLSVVVGGVEGDSLVTALDLEGICCSTGSACTTGSTEPSHVLTAMGFPDDEARGALRLSLGRTTTDDEIERASEVIPAVIQRLRHGSAAISIETPLRTPERPENTAAVGSMLVEGMTSAIHTYRQVNDAPDRFGALHQVLWELKSRIAALRDLADPHWVEALKETWNSVELVNAIALDRNPPGLTDEDIDEIAHFLTGFESQLSETGLRTEPGVHPSMAREVPA